MNYPHQVLMRVQKPGRYLGGEAGICRKDKHAAARFCLCFPDVYEVGMSWAGLDILYSMLNLREDLYCERAFAPWEDMETILRAEGLPLKTLETGDSLKEMDMLGFSINHELCYTNLLNMLDLSGIPLLAKDRTGDLGEGFPLICAGGPSTCNPEPLSDFVDFFYIGEAEVTLGLVLDAFTLMKKQSGDKEAFLREIAVLPGVYVPRFYEAAYKEDGTLLSLKSCLPGLKDSVKKSAAPSLDGLFLPQSFLVPNIGSIHDRAALEIFRGCLRGCRFCQAGYIYRPCRERAPEVLLAQAKHMLDCTGHDEISLLSLSTGDYSRFPELVSGALELDKNVSLSLPSLRVDAFSLDVMNRASNGRKSGLTFAPEAGSQRLRDIINKNLTEDEILEGCRLAFLGGWTKIKLYCMLGLPFETEEDIVAMGALADKIVDLFRSIPKDQRGRGLSINLSASCFVPKPHTPFQFAPQASQADLEVKQRLLKNSIRSKQVKFTYHKADASIIEGSMARGDRRLGKVIHNAFLLGARFDGWSDMFNHDIWLKAFDESGLNIDFYAHRERSYGEIFPWDHIQMGPSKQFLINEMNRAHQGITTPACKEACAGCGVDACEIRGVAL